ncbi:hypothetical protein BBO99_00006610 [Phytophthora kernoviae]|uniref:FAR1 domain-containing protein n=2 Tax=Phytophthora kernoviae TaxID=325452 RepID=A0A3R7GT52_9STRA|nr:hypothetical protein G195_005191 [Phytophthora kernoviae 00238/432]KAG2521395.1 hypothetical protein JM16_006246 [Phytophthora kernoviae]KAG2522571.1 hypothetical protein JM18_006047 [Phytophthora kernoviae]RLN37829.1 hypothetical protein BBI17_006621 [Phytophthora kernoviae]RLN77640.1 hypothetical protein BBO99_00006610 [Phytophthora kernoviae]
MTAEDASAQTQPSSPPPHELHEVPPLERRVFDTWKEFHQFMEMYARRTFQLFRKRTSTSVKLRNRRMGERAKALTLVCTHSGSFVSRGTGRRSRQDVRATRCNVQVNACLKLVDPRCNRYQVTVTRALLTHNHRVDEETYRQYSNTRVNLPDALLNCVELMRKTGMKPRDVRTYIMENSSCAPTLKDVKNMLQRLRTQEDAALVNTDPPQSQLDDLQTADQNIDIGAIPTCTLQDKVIREYRNTAAVSVRDETCSDVDPTTQFKVAHAMGNAVATLLAEVPASEFANAFRVMELAEDIVRERLVSVSKTMVTSEEDQSEAVAGLEAGLGATDVTAGSAPLNDRWP